MKTLIVYFSMNGHTRKAAKAIAAELANEDVTIADLAFQGKMIAFSMEVENIRAGDLSHFEFDRDVLDLAAFDRVFIGMPVYGGAPAWAFNAFMKNCKNTHGKEWVVFATCATSGKTTLDVMKQEIEKTGGKVAGQALFKTLFGVSMKKVRAFAGNFK